MHGQGFGQAMAEGERLAAVLGTLPAGSPHGPQPPVTARTTGTERAGCDIWQDCEAQAGLQRKQPGEDRVWRRSGWGVHPGACQTPASHLEPEAKNSFLP